MSMNEWCLKGNIELSTREAYYVNVFFSNQDGIKFDDEYFEPDINPLIALYKCNPVFVFYPVGDSRPIDHSILYYFDHSPLKEEIDIFIISLLITQNGLRWSYDT
jgi:hypothetical protein